MRISQEEMRTRILLVLILLMCVSGIATMGGILYFQEHKAEVCQKLPAELKQVLCK